MADDVDIADAQMSEATARTIAAARARAAAIPAGDPGDCDLCGEWSGRLVRGACAPCRDRHGLG